MNIPDTLATATAPISSTTELPAKSYDVLTRFLLMIIGVDKTILATRCRPQDVSTFRAQGGLLVGSITLTASIFILISHKLFGGTDHIDPVLILGSLAISGQVGLVDAYVFFRASHFDTGVNFLSKWGGLAVSSEMSKHMASALKFAVRAALSVPLSLLFGIFLGIMVYSSDIRAILDQNYFRNNDTLFTLSAISADESIGHAAQSLKVKEEEISALSAQLTSLRSNAIDGANSADDQSAQKEIDSILAQQVAANEDVRRSESTEALELGGVGGPRTSGLPGNGPRYRAAVQEVANAKAHAHQIDEALAAARARLDARRYKSASSSESARRRAEQGVPAFEDKLRRANLELTELKTSLDDLKQNRNETIRKAVDTSPSRVNHNDGVLAQIVALGELGKRDAKIALTIWLFEIAAVALEMSALCSKALVQIPTDYATVVARDAILHSVKTVDEMMAEMSAGPKNTDPPSPANGNYPESGPIIDVTPAGGSKDPRNPPPPKRGRGRPKKPRLLN